MGEKKRKREAEEIERERRKGWTISQSRETLRREGESLDGARYRLTVRKREKADDRDKDRLYVLYT